MSDELKACPFCGSHDVEVQGKPAILDALDSVCCNECSADAPYPVWNTRAQIPRQGGEAVAWLTSDKRHLVFSGVLDRSQYVEQGMTPLYTHPADQVAQPDAELVELLREARELIEHGDFREGHCMCGSAVEAHGFGDGHSPVDAGVYYAGQVMERIDAKMATLK